MVLEENTYSSSQRVEFDSLKRRVQYLANYQKFPLTQGNIEVNLIEITEDQFKLSAKKEEEKSVTFELSPQTIQSNDNDDLLKEVKTLIENETGLKKASFPRRFDA